jgi:hypothetical protein
MNSKYNTFKIPKHNLNNCLKCDNPMWSEGPIFDDIQLCHACYDSDSLIEFGYFAAEDLQ